MIKIKLKAIVLMMPLLGLLALLLISCEEESAQISHQRIEDKIALNKENDLLHDFANVFAQSMNNKAGRVFIKGKALEEFDGDYDILFAKVKDEKFSGSSLKSSGCETFGDFLGAFYKNDCREKGSVDFDLLIASLLRDYPLLQISIPEVYEQSTENWDVEEYTPLVAVLPVNYNENVTKVITAYDIEGNVFYLDIDEFPQKPVIVIGQNERLVAIPKSQINSGPTLKYLEDPCMELYYETQDYEYLMPVDCGGSGTGGTGGGSTGGTSSYDRDTNNNKDNLYKARFQSKDAFRQVEPWPSGRPEFKVIVTYIEKVGSSYETKTITKILSKSDWLTRYVLWCDLKTKHINLPVITWDKEKYGTTMKYTWIEQDDSDSKTELTIAASSKFGEDDEIPVNGSVKVTISVKDDEAGESIVEYMDNTDGDGTEYRTGIVRFWVNQ